MRFARLRSVGVAALTHCGLVGATAHCGRTDSPSSQMPFDSMPIYLWKTRDQQLFCGFRHVEWPSAKVAIHHFVVDRLTTPARSSRPRWPRETRADRRQRVWVRGSDY
jgi:hypothetical protein